MKLFGNKEAPVKSVDTIVSSLDTIYQELLEHNKAMKEKAASEKAIADSHMMASANFDTEALRADAIANNLNRLLSPPGEY